MSQELVDRILEGLEAFNRGDDEAAVANLPEDVEWVVLDLLPDQGPFRGPEGVRRFFEAWRESFTEIRAEVEEIVDGDDHVIAMLHMVGRGRDSGVEVRTPTFAQLWVLQGDEVLRVRMLQTKEEALQMAAASRR